MPITEWEVLELSTIYEPVNEDMIKVEDALKAVSLVNFDHLSELLAYSLKSEGKRIRPALTLLAGKFYDYNLNHLLPMATAIEVMHTATLVHDDAIDKSSARRGRPTINELWSDEEAVLLGDYLFADAGALTATTNNLRVIKLFATTLRTISTGELSQAFNNFNLNQSRSQYFQRVAKKTAALFSMATESGAVLSQAPEKSIQILIDYGQNLGIAFQIVDDILDFTGTEKEVGKPIGSDLAQGTLTLPALLLLEHYPEENPVKRIFSHKENLTKDNIELALELICNSPIIQECYKVASEYCAKARQNLKLLPENSSRHSLIELTDFIVSRKK